MWVYLHYGLMRVRSDTNMCLSSVLTRRYSMITGDSLLQQLNDLSQVKTKDAIRRIMQLILQTMAQILIKRLAYGWNIGHPSKKVVNSFSQTLKYISNNNLEIMFLNTKKVSMSISNKYVSRKSQLHPLFYENWLQERNVRGWF